MGLESEATYEGRKLLTLFHPMIGGWLALIGSSERCARRRISRAIAQLKILIIALAPE
jgi:hypothetical protein